MSTASTHLASQSKTRAAMFPHMVVRVCCWAVAVALGAAQAWTSRFSMNPDGISYLDIGDAYWRHDWHNAINAYWSPLYSWILGFFLNVVKPSPYWEYPLVHLVNFIIYVAALTSFDFFLLSLIKGLRRPAPDNTGAEEQALPESAFMILGYALFVWTGLTISTAIVTPDLCVAAFWFLDCALLIKAVENPARGIVVALGFALGLGFLAKAILLPLGVIVLILLALTQKQLRAAFISALIFATLSAPFISFISLETHRFTFGDSGRITYAAYVDGLQPWYPGDGGTFSPEGIGHADDIEQPSRFAVALRHLPRKVFDVPATYSFEANPKGTYPFWFDVSYWQDGIQPRFELIGERRVVANAALYLLYLVGSIWHHLLVAVGLLLLFLLNPLPSRCFRRALKRWYLATAAMCGVCAYVTVHLEFRYVAPFICLIWLILFSGVSLPPTAGMKAILHSVVVIVSFSQIIFPAMSMLRDRRQSPEADYSRAAIALRASGLQPGDRIAELSDEPWGAGGPFIARLAKLQIISQVNSPSLFWQLPPAVQEEDIAAIAATGAKAVLSWGPYSRPQGWKRLGATEYFIYQIPPEGQHAR